MLSMTRSFALLYTALLTGPIQAQYNGPSAYTNNKTIVVTGRGPHDSARIRNLAQKITPDLDFDHPIARFADPVCFAVAGLPSTIITDIADRMVADAQEAGIRLGGKRCDPNVLVIFVDDGHLVVNRLKNERPSLFAFLDLPEVQRLGREPGPVHAVIASATRSRDGDPIYIEGAVGTPMLKVSTASSIDLPIRRDIQRSVLMIDRKAVVGLSPIQLADYAAMRTLAVVRPTASSMDDTILKLFAPDVGARPVEYTVFDRGYLKGLYSGASNKRGIIKIDEISEHIHKDSDAH